MIPYDKMYHNTKYKNNQGEVKIFRFYEKFLLPLDYFDDGNLINTDNDDSLRDDLDYILIRYNWNIGFLNYIREKS